MQCEWLAGDRLLIIATVRKRNLQTFETIPMKKIPLILLMLGCTTLVACSGEKINGHNEKSAYRSVKMIKNRLHEEMRVEYEMSFWMIRDAKKDDAEFLAAVDGKKAEEIIAMGKEIYQQRKNEGFAEYQQYKTWEEMMAKYDRDRIKQGKVKSDVKPSIDDPKTGNRDIVYKL